MVSSRSNRGIDLLNIDGHTTVVFIASIKEMTIIQKLQAVALDIKSFRRPKLSIEKYGLKLGQQRFDLTIDGKTDSHETKKNWIPSTPETISESSADRPMFRSNVIGRK